MPVLHGEPVAVGDRVYDIVDGWGQVVGVRDAPYEPGARVRFSDGSERWFTEAGGTYGRVGASLYWHDPVLAAPPKDPGSDWELLRAMALAAAAVIRDRRSS